MCEEECEAPCPIHPVTGRTLRQNLEDVEVQLADQDVVYAIDSPLKPTGGILVIKGNLAPDGAVLKSSGVTIRQHRGPARVFEKEETAMQAILERRDDRLIADKAVEEPIGARHHHSGYRKAGESGHSTGVKLHRRSTHGQRRIRRGQWGGNERVNLLSHNSETLLSFMPILESVRFLYKNAQVFEQLDCGAALGGRLDVVPGPAAAADDHDHHRPGHPADHRHGAALAAGLWYAVEEWRIAHGQPVGRSRQGSLPLIRWPADGGKRR